MDDASAEITHQALDALLTVVAKASDDLRTFHTAVVHARASVVAPLPRATVVITEHIIDNLTRVDEELREVLLALGVNLP